MKIFLFPAAIAAAFSFSIAAAEDTSHADADTVRVADFIGTVKINTVDSGGVHLTRTMGTNAGYPVHVEEAGGVLIVRSDENPDDAKWWKEVEWRKNHENAFALYLKAYPTLVLNVPRGTAVEFDSAVVSLAADNTGGALAVSRGHVNGKIGDISTGDIKIHGSGDLETGNVAGVLKVAIYGSGDFTAKRAASFDADINGSGDIIVADIAGDTSIAIHGSGDVSTGKIGGAFAAKIQGSGDVETGDVAGGADLSVNGSGDIMMASMHGPGMAVVHGSGDIDIAGGRAENLKVDISGSGGFEFGGVASNPVVHATHSAEIFINKHEGAVRASGGGDIEISGVEYGDDD